MDDSKKLLHTYLLYNCFFSMQYRGGSFSLIWRAGVDSEIRVGSGMPMVPKLLIFSRGVDFSSSRRHKSMLTLFQVGSGYTHCVDANLGIDSEIGVNAESRRRNSK